MLSRRFASVSILLSLFLFSPLSSLADDTGSNGNKFLGMDRKIPNFSVVSPELVRGGKPKEGGLALLKDAGVRTVINLRGDDEDSQKEERDAKALGLNYIGLPLTHWTTIPQNYIDRFLSSVGNKQTGPVFIHCTWGADRTGAMVGIYRMMKCGWTSSQAYQEMISFGFHPFFRNLTKSVFAYSAKIGSADRVPPLFDGMINLFYKPAVASDRTN